MSVDTIVKMIPTSKGPAEGVALKWCSFSLLLIGAPKGFLACCIFDLEVLDGFDCPAALVDSSPTNPIGTLERMVTRDIIKVNEKAAALGIKTGMDAMEALEKLF